MTDRELMADFMVAWESTKVEPMIAAVRAMRERLEQPETPPARTWTGLTVAERKALWIAANNPAEFGVLLEAKLREKNA